MFKLTVATTWITVPLMLYRRVRELRKATIGFVMSGRPPVRMKQLGAHWTDFDINLIFKFSKIFDKMQVTLISDKNNEYFT